MGFPGDPGGAVALSSAGVPPRDAALVVLDDVPGPRLRAAVRRARRQAPGALVAAPAAAGGAFDRSGADVVVVPLPPSDPAPAVLAAGVRAAGRPVLVDVRSPAATPDDLVAAVDAGAAGWLVHTGDPGRDRELADAALAADAARLDDAPKATIIICNHNGAAFLDRCLASTAALRYPDYEVLLVDDGSTDDSVAIGRRHGVRVIELEKGGLAVARNTGLREARGEFALFLDGDAEADPQLLARTWRLLDRLGADGTGGPNLPFADAGFAERVVSASPGPPIPVVEPSGDALHLAGCNMAFRTERARRVGFDPRFPGAGDDVDFCLRMLGDGARLVLHPTAVIRHHRRDSLRGFLAQQAYYGGGSPQHAEVHGGRGVIPEEPRTLARRLDPRRPRPVFVGPQAIQRFTVASEPLHFDLPLKLLVLGALAGTVAGAAVPGLRLSSRAAIAAAPPAAVLATIAARVPVFAPPPGPAGVLQRLVTAGMWLAQPTAWRWGAKRASGLR